MAIRYTFLHIVRDINDSIHRYTNYRNQNKASF